MPSFTPYDKQIVMVATLVVSLGSFALGQNFGLDPTTAHWVGLIVGLAGTVLHFFQDNKNTAALKPGQVVVAESQVSPLATIVQRRQP